MASVTQALVSIWRRLVFRLASPIGALLEVIEHSKVLRLHLCAARVRNCIARRPGGQVPRIRLAAYARALT